MSSPQDRYQEPGLVFIRPNAFELLASLSGKCELALWSASTPGVGEIARHALDGENTIFGKNVIYRDARWWKGEAGTKKPVDLLGRDPDKVLIIENCFLYVSQDPTRALLVPDFEDPTTPDSVLEEVGALISAMIASKQPVPQFLSEYTPPVKRETSRDPPLTFYTVGQGVSLR
eukprot:Hpha_TRINITY_DN8159_c0_g1::TRINITY_DN8159_c0_g1_i1::g.172199::m.172199